MYYGKHIAPVVRVGRQFTGLGEEEYYRDRNKYLVNDIPAMQIQDWYKAAQKIAAARGTSSTLGATNASFLDPNAAREQAVQWLTRVGLRGMGAIPPAPSIDVISALPLKAAPPAVQQILAPVTSGGLVAVTPPPFSITDWISAEAIAGTGISNGLLFGGIGGIVVLALLTRKRR